MLVLVVVVVAVAVVLVVPATAVAAAACCAAVKLSNGMPALARVRCSMALHSVSSTAPAQAGMLGNLTDAIAATTASCCSEEDHKEFVVLGGKRTSYTSSNCLPVVMGDGGRGCPAGSNVMGFVKPAHTRLLLRCELCMAIMGFLAGGPASTYQRGDHRLPPPPPLLPVLQQRLHLLQHPHCGLWVQ